MLADADLKRRNLESIDFEASDFSRSDLYSCRLSEANLRNARLCGANLRGIEGRELILAGADCAGADFEGANLCGADLRDADLSTANLSGAFLDAIKTNESTKLPLKKSTVSSRPADKHRSTNPFDSFIPPIPDRDDVDGVENYLLANADSFNWVLDSALRRWSNNRNPTDNLRSLVSTAQGMARFVRRNNSKANGFPFAKSVLVGYLLDGRIRESLVELSPTVQSWRKQAHSLHCLDSGVCNTLVTGKKARGWDSFLEKGFVKRPFEPAIPKTFIRSFQHYVAILQAAQKGDADRVLLEVKSAEKCFRRWSKSEMFYGEPIDFRLAMTIKFATRKIRGLNEVLETEHVYRW